MLSSLLQKQFQWKTSNKDPSKISECFATGQNTKQLQHCFFKILQKYYQLPISGTLDISGHFDQKQ